MFETNSFQVTTSLGQMTYSRHTLDTRLSDKARNFFQAAITRAWISRFVSALTGRSQKLFDLSEVVSEGQVKDRYYDRIQSVPLSQIRGSEGRCSDFDAHFNPLSERTGHRWRSVMMARLQSVELPPVELIQVNDVYFVRDGHHRISVALALGQEAIDAEVTVWKVETSGSSEPAPQAAFSFSGSKKLPAAA